MEEKEFEEYWSFVSDHGIGISSSLSGNENLFGNEDATGLFDTGAVGDGSIALQQPHVTDPDIFDWPALDDSNIGTLERPLDASSTDIWEAPTDDVWPLHTEEVCYGMLLDVGVKMKWALNSLSPDVRDIDGRRHIQMQLVMQEKHGLVRLPQGRSVGVLNSQVHAALSTCIGVESFHADVSIPQDEWDAKIKKIHGKGGATNRRNGIMMNAELTLFGPDIVGDLLAKSLGEHQMFLQPPLDNLSEIPYKNPQSLSRQITDVCMEVDTEDFGLRAALESRGFHHLDEPLESVKIAGSTQLANAIADIDKFFEDLPVSSYRPIALPPREMGMLSSLFPHQKRALDFMNRRKSAVFDDDKTSLWELKSRADGDQYYQHSITGARSRTPEDFAGGILADDMGLGKTLTTLTTLLPPASVPQILLNTWAREIDQHFYPGSIQWLKYHGQDRKNYDYKLGQYHIILTTYGTVMSECRRGSSALNRTFWYRLILDEAHTIRNCSSKQFKALNGIQSHIRWCLTGTPIQNSLEDLGSLIRFLRMPLFSEPATFRKYVAMVRVRKESDTADFENLRLMLSSICLRRNRSIMPGKGYKTETHRPELTERERGQYQTLEQACKRAIQIGSKRQGGDAAHHRVMEALLRLRLFCNNGPDPRGTLIASRVGSRPDEVLSFFQQSGEAMCNYCSVDIMSLGPIEDTESGYLTPCQRLVCGGCIEEYRLPQSEGSLFTCSICHRKHEVDGSIVHEGVDSTRTRKYPSKVTTLVKDIRDHHLASKCIVFSFWKTSLNIVGKALTDYKIKFLRVDGDMPAKKRNSTLLEFQNKSTWRVLLMTFSTGAAGLNGLTVANRVHLLEPQWNPAVEQQAIGRVLRLNQDSKVTIIRYAVEKSIEDVIKSKQMWKLQLAGGGFLGKEEKQERRAHQWQQIQNHLDTNQAISKDDAFSGQLAVNVLD